MTRVWIEKQDTGAIIAETKVSDHESAKKWIEMQKRTHGYQALLEFDATWQTRNGERVTFKVSE